MKIWFVGTIALLAAGCTQQATSNYAGGERLATQTGTSFPRHIGNGYSMMSTVQRKQTVISIAFADKKRRLTDGRADEAGHKAQAFAIARNEICPQRFGGGVPVLHEGTSPAFSSKGWWVFAIKCK